jgi:hypothetical protein
MVKAGDRIELMAMPEDPDPLPIGATGTVMSAEYHDAFKSTQVHVRWDAPHERRSLTLIIPPDRVRVL